MTRRKLPAEFPVPMPGLEYLARPTCRICGRGEPAPCDCHRMLMCAGCRRLHYDLQAREAELDAREAELAAHGG